MTSTPTPPRGRGASWNPVNRFEKIEYIRDPDADPEEETLPSTTLYDDTTQEIIARNDSPDVGFERSVNPYRGCEHGCIYCFARPTHEYLGFSAGLDFESKIVVKRNAPELLRAELMNKRWVAQPIAMSGVTDCYQPIERTLELTRRCLEVLAEFGNPVIIITKNHLVTRDVDILARLAALGAVSVCVSVTTLDSKLQSILEPRTSIPEKRLQAIETLSRAGIPVGALVAPVIPAITDHEIPAILAAVRKAGAHFAGHTMLRLPWAVAPLFERWLEEHFPDRKERVLNRVREIRGGKLNDASFGSRMQGRGQYADQIHTLFEIACLKEGLNRRSFELSTEHFRRPSGPQLGLF